MSENDQQTGATTSSSGNGEVAVCLTNLLLDEPEATDSFSGPHERIAENIASLICPKDVKGISIGVEGSWGSGKSTVARLLGKKLKHDTNIALISFDAWAHEGDPLRRTFLETLIRRFQELEWIPKEHWEDQIEVLANRRETVTTKDKLAISGWGRIVACLLPFIPIGGVFIAAATREPVTLVPGPIAWRFSVFFVLGLVLTFIPFFVLLWRYQHETDILGIFFNKGPTEKTTVTRKTGNPTSIEFEDTFTNLIEAALIEPSRRIVVVLDNLDRVDAKDALVIWSTLQTFLQHRELDRPVWRDRLWIIVLYDLKGISALWQQDDDEPQKPQTAASFIDKSFQIRFEVPSLVLSDWRGFLMDKLKYAFPKHNDSDLHEVYRVMAIGQAQGDRLPTIRELKLFVNQIGAIHRQWSAGPARTSDVFPLAHIAYYVHLRRKNTDIIKELLTLQPQLFPAREYRDLLGEGVRESLAAMVFNVEVDVAQQLLFTDRIKKALTEASSEEMRKLEAQIPKGFWEMFEQTVTTEWTGGEMVRVADAALALEQSQLLAKASAPAVRSVMKTMCEQAATVSSWTPLDEKKAQGLATLVKWKHDSVYGVNEIKSTQFVDSLLKSIATGLKDQARRIDTPFDARSWLQGLNLIFAEVPAASRAAAVKRFSNVLSEQMAGKDAMSANEVEAILEVLSELAEDPGADNPAREDLKDLAGQGQIASRLRNTSEISSNTVAWGLYVLFRYSAFVDLLTFTASSGSGTSLGVLGDATIKAFTEKLDRFKQLPLLFTAYRQNEDLKVFVVESLKSVLTMDSAKLFFSEENVIERIEFVSREVVENLGQEKALEAIVKSLLEDQPLEPKIIEGEFHPESAWLYKLILDTPGEHSRLVSWCKSGLQSVSTEVWQGQLERSGQALELAFRLSEPDLIELGPNYYEALKAHASHIASYTDVPQRVFPGNAVALLGSVDSDLRSSFLDHLLSLLSETPPALFFDQFGEELSVQLLSTNRGANVLQLLASKDQSLTTLKWLDKTLSQNETVFLERYSAEPVLVTFKEHIERRISEVEPSAEVVGPLLGIAKALQIEILPDGALAIAVHEDAKWRVEVFDAYGFRQRLTEDLESGDPDEKMQPAWSPKGLKLAYVVPHTYGSEIRVFDLLVHKKIDLFRDEYKQTSRPSWSRDGRRLAFVKHSGHDSNISTVDVETKEQKTLTQGGQNDRPCWSPDNQRIAFQEAVNGMTMIGVMNADGSEKVLLTDGPNDVDPSWSSDGMRIVFARSGSAVSPGVYEVNASSGGQGELIVGDTDPHCPIWLVDGQKLLFQSRSEIYRANTVNGEKKKIAKGIDPSWLSSGESLRETP